VTKLNDLVFVPPCIFAEVLYRV